ncbi:flagellar biosynthesis anti-sigma factor FlgM [bacterium]|nr:flagellar biosynthesis anti-sigma factor FlgM [bacterium]
MKIDGQHPKLPVQDKSTLKGKEKDNIQLDRNSSDTIKKKDIDQFAFNKIKDKADSEPDINLEKVNALKAKIKNGEYQIDTKKLASSLIKNSLLEDL